MKAKLVVVSGAARPSEFKLKLPTIIGRSRSVDLPVGHPLISRQHCELFADGEVLKIRDLGSLNGTFVREERIAEDTVLEPGDEFTVGPLTFKAVYGQMPVAAPAADEEDDLSPPSLKNPSPKKSPPEEIAGDPEHGPPPQFDDEQPAGAFETVMIDDVTVPVEENQKAMGEDDFSLADSTDEGLDTDFDSVVFIPQPAAPRAGKAAADKSSSSKGPKGKAQEKEAAKPAASKPDKGKPQQVKAEKGKTPADKSKAAKTPAAQGQDEIEDFAPPPQQHGKSHRDADIDDILGFLQ